ncbi:hypothetical protein GEMRC1_000281 [Eukaryota sp. GEM-RC1]
MKGTSAENLISGMFEGKIYSYIKCLNVEYESSRVETFYDLSLDVKGCSTIYDSFEKYTEDEILEGDNQYSAEGHGHQDARKGVKFRSFPPILHCHLKRFEYDFYTDDQVKINDKYEFFPEICLDDYLDDGADKSVSQKYILHSVLVHSGDVHGGHYYAFIRPSLQKNSWFKFDDDIVDEVDEKDAVEENYGGEMTWPVTGGMGTAWNSYAGGMYGSRVQSPIKRTIKKCANAYMLVYIRESDYADVMADVAKEEIPAPLFVAFKQEQEKARKKKHLDKLQEKKMLLKVATPSDLAVNEPFSFVDWNKIEPLSFEKESKLTDVAAHLVQLNKVPTDDVSFWKIDDTDDLNRPKSLIPATTVEYSTIDSITTIKTMYGNSWNNNYGTYNNYSSIWDLNSESDNDCFDDDVFASVNVESTVDDDVEVQSKQEDVDIPTNQYLLVLDNSQSTSLSMAKSVIVIKEYLPKTEEVVFRSYLIVDSSIKTAALLESIADVLDCSVEGLSAIKESEDKEFDTLDPVYERLSTGIVIVCQKGNESPTLEQFYTAKCQQHNLQVVLLHSTGASVYSREEKKLGPICLDLTLTYQEVAETLVSSFDDLKRHPAENLIFHSPANYSHSHYHYPSAMSTSPSETPDLRSILKSKFSDNIGTHLYVKALPFARDMEDHMKNITVVRVGDFTKRSVSYHQAEGQSLWVPKEGLVVNLRESVRTAFGLESNDVRPSKMIMFHEYTEPYVAGQVSVGKKFELLDDSSNIPSNLANLYVQFLTAPVPTSFTPILVRHMTAPTVYYHATKGWVQYFSHPCYVLATPETTFGQLLSESLAFVKMNPEDPTLQEVVIRVLNFSSTQPEIGGEVKLEELVNDHVTNVTQDVFVALQHEQPKQVYRHFRLQQKGISIRE